MNYETEPWYKLYIRESTEDKLLPVLNRALRDFLLRLAKSRKDGTVLGKTENPGADLATALGARPDEAPTIAAFVATMLEDGYLTHRKGRLWITNFVRAQEARSPGATRQRKWRAKSKGDAGETPSQDGERNANGNGESHGDVSVASRETSLKIRSEKRREETRTAETSAGAREAAAAPVGKVPCPADLALTPEQSAMLLTAGIPGYAQLASAAKFVTKARSDLTDERPLVTWRKCLVSAVSGDWNNPQTRPKSDAQRRAAEGTNADWPTDESLRTREEIRAGKHGKSLQAKERAGNVDWTLAKREIRERNAEIAERAAERRQPSSRPPPGLAPDVPGGSLKTLSAGIGRTIT